MLSQENTESLLVFNPKEEAILDAAPNLLLSSQSYKLRSQEHMLKEALEHIGIENEVLKDQLLETREMLKIHKNLLNDVLKKQHDTVIECKETGKKLNDKIDD